MNRRVTLSVVLFVVGVVADVVTTYAAIAHGPFVEGSPVGGYFIERFGLLGGMAVTKVVGMAVIAVPVAIARRTRQTVLVVMFGGVGLLSVGAAIHNLAKLVGV